MENNNELAPGLYLVATPIGNLEDITFRAIRVLRQSDVVLCEDTRTSGKLLSHYDIKTHRESYHEHNKLERIPSIIERLKSGQCVALISDAGTPGISDPGEELAQACIKEGIDVFPVPGAVAAICAVTASGISSRRFAFEAFLPKNKKKRRRILSELRDERRSIIIYEAPHHLVTTLGELADHLGDDRRIVLCRELTKRYEEKREFTIAQALKYYRDKEPRGEYVVVIEGKPLSNVEKEEKDKWEAITIEEHFARYTDCGMDRKDAMKRVAADRGIRKKEVYDALFRQ